tara:strand:+ start:73 stop:381 length:309 start_codon:yes stop_codon:yes gene_type:complete
MILYFIGVCVLLEPSKNELNCLKTQFTCDNKQCIDIIEYCNNKRDCNNDNVTDNVTDNVNYNKSIVFDSVYNSKYCEENNGYLVPVNRNNILIVEAIYEDII